MTARRLLWAIATCVALAAASLLLADEPVYDSWAWLVWGRELTSFGLDATTGPSWKPLPVLVAAPLSLAGDAAPQVWLVLVRSAWLLSFVLAGELAYLLAAPRSRPMRAAAAGFAAAGVVLLTDDVTMWGRQAAGGMSEPLLVALVLAAVRAAIARRWRLALVLGALAALIRPEAWVLLALYASWCWRVDRRGRPIIAAIALAVPLLWLAPRLLGAGDGGARAQTGTSDPFEALGRAALLPLTVAWPLAVLALRDRVARILAAGALTWLAAVAAMTLAGFAGLPRFNTPAAAIVCVLGGAGLAHLIARPRAPGRALLVVILAALAVTLAELPSRVAEVPEAWRTAARISGSHARLRALVASVGREPLLRCGRLATSDVLVRTALAWQLHAPMSQVVSFGRPSRSSGAFVVGPQGDARPGAGLGRLGTPLARRGEWRVYSVGCPAATASGSESIAGVAGATR